MDAHSSKSDSTSPGSTPSTISKGEQPAKILVVDDSKTILTFISSVLRLADYEVRTSRSIWISHDVSKFHPDLVLMDVNMGTSKGTNAVTALRDKAITNGTQIVLHSSLSAVELHQLTDECGADGYIQKTQDPEELLRQVVRFLPVSKRPRIIERPRTMA